ERQPFWRYDRGALHRWFQVADRLRVVARGIERAFDDDALQGASPPGDVHHLARRDLATGRDGIGEVQVRGPSRVDGDLHEPPALRWRLRPRVVLIRHGLILRTPSPRRLSLRSPGMEPLSLETRTPGDARRSSHAKGGASRYLLRRTASLTRAARPVRPRR